MKPLSVNRWAYVSLVTVAAVGTGSHRKVRCLCLIVISAFLALLSACSKEISISLPHTAPVLVLDLNAKTERSILPNTEAHRKISRWVAENREGWNTYMATPPARGVILRAPELDIQFIDDHAIVHTPDGIFFKKASPSSYTFLFAEGVTQPKS